MAHTLLSRILRAAGGVRYKRPALALWGIAPIILIFGHSVIVIGQPDSIYRLSEGTRIKLKLDAEVSSRAASVNDTFVCFVAEPVAVRDAVVLPVGSVVEGRITAVAHAGAAGHNGRLEVVFETLRLGGESRRIDGMLITPRTHPSRGFGVWSVLGGAAAGAALGGVARSAGGVLIGGAAGAGAGGAFALLKRGKDAGFKRGEKIEIELRSPVVLPVADY